MENTTLDSTPVTTSEPPAAAPATSAPTPSATTSQRPTTASELATWMEHAAAAPTPDASANPDTAATAPPDATNPDSATHPSAKEGPIPFAAHKTALDNARTKVRAEVEAEWQPYAWAKAVPRETLDRFSGIAQSMDTDPVGFIDRYFTEVEAHPTHGPAMRSWAAKTLGSRRGSAAVTDTEPQADVQITDGQGNVTGLTYSAPQLAARDAWRERQLLAKVDQQYGPMRQAHEQSTKAQEQAAIRERQVNATADAQTAEILDLLEGNETLAPQVLQTMTAHPDWSPRKCALHVRDTAIVGPRLQPKANDAALESIRKKAAGNTVTGSGTGAPSVRPTNAKELAAWMEAHA